MSKTKAWIQAFRLRTLPLAFSSILLGAFLAIGNNAFDGLILSLSLLTTLFLQVLSNLANDYGDAQSGVDSSQREGPSRTVQSGLISKSQMKAGLIFCSILALISGVSLIIYAFPGNWKLSILFLILGLGAIAAAIKYTVGKNPYGYSGFGDLFVLIFFGYVGVLGSYFLYAGALDFHMFLPATTCGLFAVAVLNVNNIRDIESDKISGKYSVPVRLGRNKAVYYHWILLALGAGSAIVFAIQSDFYNFDWLFLAVIPLLFLNARAVYVKKTAKELDPFLKQMALTTLLFVLLFGWALT
ncbi:MAG: 1,4-dihydroxy-2-naphthoate octaprenyltransferase [Cyclobacteriaceae bacterium]|jgi:1,4-dihydroxy-2-naphthoate octaprenyltransferase